MRKGKSFTITKFHHPKQLVDFGKYSSKTIGYIIENDKQYYDWLVGQGVKMAYPVTEYAEGNDLLQWKITWKLDSNVLRIFYKEFYEYPMKSKQGNMYMHTDSVKKTLLEELEMTFTLEGRSAKVILEDRGALFQKAHERIEMIAQILVEKHEIETYNKKIDEENG